MCYTSKRDYKGCNDRPRHFYYEDVKCRTPVNPRARDGLCARPAIPSPHYREVLPRSLRTTNSILCPHCNGVYPQVCLFLYTGHTDKSRPSDQMNAIHQHYPNLIHIHGRGLFFLPLHNFCLIIVTTPSTISLILHSSSISVSHLSSYLVVTLLP